VLPKPIIAKAPDIEININASLKNLNFSGFGYKMSLTRLPLAV
jgi:hypothetical protein